MLAVLAQATLEKRKTESVSFVVSLLNTLEHRTKDQIRCIVNQIERC